MAGGVSSSFTSDDDVGMMTDINVTPLVLVDVVLVLLIVFMITMPAIVGLAPLDVNLPKSGAIAVATADRHTLDILLRREESGEINLYLNEIPTDQASLKAMLEQAEYQPLVEQPVSIVADRTIPYGDVVKVLDMLVSLGLHKIALDTQHVGGL